MNTKLPTIFKNYTEILHLLYGKRRFETLKTNLLLTSTTKTFLNVLEDAKWLKEMQFEREYVVLLINSMIDEQGEFGCTHPWDTEVAILLYSLGDVRSWENLAYRLIDCGNFYRAALIISNIPLTLGTLDSPDNVKAVLDYNVKTFSPRGYGNFFFDGTTSCAYLVDIQKRRRWKQYQELKKEFENV